MHLRMADIEMEGGDHLRQGPSRPFTEDLSASLCGAASRRESCLLWPSATIV
jgi:hypothetical protein